MIEKFFRDYLLIFVKFCEKIGRYVYVNDILEEVCC